MTSAVGVSMDAERASGAAKQRRERRLRSWLRHERMTVAAELSAALHHSRDGGQVSRVGLRAQKTAARSPCAACPRSTGLPPLPDLCSGEVHDATLEKFLLRQTLLQRKKRGKRRGGGRSWSRRRKRRRMRSGCRRSTAGLPLAGHSPGATELGPGRLRPAVVTELGPTELGPSELGPVLSFKG